MCTHIHHLYTCTQRIHVYIHKYSHMCTCICVCVYLCLDAKEIQYYGFMYGYYLLE